MTWSPEGRRRERPEMKWEREVKRVLKQKNVTLEDAVNQQLWRKATENQ
jgi:ribosomal protein L31E